MSDLKKFTTMLNKAGVVFLEIEHDDGLEIKIIAKDGPNNLGYFEFFSSFFFSKEGSLKNVGVWE